MDVMKKFILFMVLIGQLFLMFGGGVAHVYADNLYQTPAADSRFTFSELGYSERLMIGPYDSIRLFFSLPPTWQLNTNAKISLRFNFAGGAASGSVTNQGTVVGGLLTILFNNRIVDTVVLDQNGPFIREISIPAGALAPISSDGRNLLSMVFDASVNCDNPDIQSTLIVSSGSEIDLQHDTISPSLDLSAFPYPIYLPQALLPTATTIVLPDAPTIGEIQSAMAGIAGLGSITNGDLTANLVTESKLTTEVRSTNNLIFVGNPSKFTVLQGVALPIPVANGKFSLSGLQDNDGVVQAAISPWNQANVLLSIGGNNDEAVIKAGQALGSGGIVTSGGRPDVSVISSIAPANEEVVSEDRTLADLGYDNQSLGGTFGQYLSYSFFASSEQTFSSEAYLDLVLSNSKLLNFDRSSLTVLLNDSVIGSLQFSDQSEQVETTRIKILAGILRRGSNKLEIVSDLVPNNSCASPNTSNTSLTIGQSSLLHLPVSSEPIGTAKNLYLDNFPSMFITDRNLADLAFVVPANDPTSWDYAAKIAYYIGAKGGISVADFKVVFGEDVPEDIRAERNLIMVGKASTLPIISEINDQLPAPFEAGKDEAIQPAMLVNYRLLPNVSVGYVQLLTSPWASDRAILTVMGNTDQGIPMAGEVLVKDNLVNQLNGNFSILYGDQILTTDTRLGLVKEGVVGGLPVAVTSNPPTSLSTPAPLGTPVIQGRAGWLLPALIGLTVAILIIAAIVIRNSFSSAATAKALKDTAEKSDK